MSKRASGIPTVMSSATSSSSLAKLKSNSDPTAPTPTALAAGSASEVKSLDDSPVAIKRVFGSQTEWDTVSIEWKDCTYRTDPKSLKSIGSSYFQAFLDDAKASPYGPIHIPLTDDLFKSGKEMNLFLRWMLGRDTNMFLREDDTRARVIGTVTDAETRITINWLERFTHLANYFDLPQFKSLLDELVRRGKEIYPPDALTYGTRYHSETLYDIGARGILSLTPDQIAKIKKDRLNCKPEHAQPITVMSCDGIIDSLSLEDLRRCAKTWHKDWLATESSTSRKK